MFTFDELLQISEQMKSTPPFSFFDFDENRSQRLIRNILMQPIAEEEAVELMAKESGVTMEDVKNFNAIMSEWSVKEDLP